MNTYYEGEESFDQAWTFIFGNPILAKDILKHDMSVGLYIPPKILVQEIKGGGTRILYQAPTSWVGPDAPDALKQALKGVDAMMEKLMTRMLSD